MIGLLDFYFAGVDDLLLAVTVNNDCATAAGALGGERSATLLAANGQRRLAFS